MQKVRSRPEIRSFAKAMQAIRGLLLQRAGGRRGRPRRQSEASSGSFRTGEVFGEMSLIEPGPAIRDRHRMLRDGMPGRLVSRLHRRNRGESGTRRRVHEDPGAAPAQDERVARVHEPGRPRVSGYAPRMPAVRRFSRRPPSLGPCCGDFRYDNQTKSSGLAPP